MTTSLLRVFRSPWVIASIALLLVNDHLLKVYAPSWLTGKLSDFAGLFFFPFLLALCLRPLFKQENRAVSAAFLLTASLFTALKTIPAANDALVGFTQRLFGITPQIVFDPTDLIALVALWPAWMLWRSFRLAFLNQAHFTRRDLGLLALAALAALASTPACRTSDFETRLMVLEGRLFVGLKSEQRGSSFYTYSNTWEPHWYEWFAPNKTLKDMLRIEPPPLPYFACDPSQKLVCYRVDGRPRIEESRDGGRTWRVSWHFPPGRLEAMRRLNHDNCGWVPDLGVSDIAVLPTDGESIVVAVTGNDGTIIKVGDELWVRVPFGGFEPTPDTPSSLGLALVELPWEITTAGIVSLAGYFLIILWVYKKSSRGPFRKKHVPRWVVHPGLIFVFVIPALILFWILNQDYYLRSLLSLAAFPGFIFIIVTLIITLSNLKDQNSGHAITVFLAVSALFFLPIGFFVLWMFAVIPDYYQTLFLSVALPLLIYIACFRRLIRTYRPAQDHGNA